MWSQIFIYPSRYKRKISYNNFKMKVVMCKVIFRMIAVSYVNDSRKFNKRTYLKTKKMSFDILRVGQDSGNIHTLQYVT